MTRDQLAPVQDAARSVHGLDAAWNRERWEEDAELREAIEVAVDADGAGFSLTGTDSDRTDIVGGKDDITDHRWCCRPAVSGGVDVRALSQ